jgi:hypothetical protein
MDTTDRFIRFAAECEAMAKISQSQANRIVWNGLAQRWLRCAKLTEKLESEFHSVGSRRWHARNHSQSLSH